MFDGCAVWLPSGSGGWAVVAVGEAYDGEGEGCEGDAGRAPGSKARCISWSSAERALRWSMENPMRVAT